MKGEELALLLAGLCIVVICLGGSCNSESYADINGIACTSLQDGLRTKDNYVCVNSWRWVKTPKSKDPK